MQLKVCGVTVAVTQSGQGERACLLLHGWGCSAEMMRGVAALLEQQMRVVAIDFPGHGAMGTAAEPPVAWGVPEYMEMTVEIIRMLSLAPCDIVAHSFGARVAILLASTYPEMVGRMILTGAAGIRKPKTAAGRVRQGVYRALRGTLDLAEKTGVLAGPAARGREALIQHFGSADYRALSESMRQTFKQVIALDLSDRLAMIESPTLLFWGSEDTETPLWMGEMMRDRIPDAGLVVEQGASHFAYLERLDKFLAIARSFLLEGRS